MNVPKYAIVIPARLESVRLPRKPLKDICGKPMILHTYERVCEVAPRSNIFIATSDQEILDICENAGANVVMTSNTCLTGTDRIAEFSKKIKADIYINVQGDEPIINPKDISSVVEESFKNPDQIINGWSWINNESEYYSPSIPKVTIYRNSQLLYMSRSPIPGNKNNEFKEARKQICIYAFPYKSLQAFAQNKLKTELEAHEDIEILRFLELGYDVKMIELIGDSLAVDTTEDLEKVRKIIKKRKLES